MALAQKTLTEPGSAVDAETVGELLHRLGDIPPERVILRPPPGAATEKDVLAYEEAIRKRLCELVDGVLVEKAMGVYESFLAAALIRHLGKYLDKSNVGIVLGADGMVRIAPRLIRIPDVSFISWSRLPDREVPREPILSLAPDLAVEVLSPGNTEGEMTRKLEQYFEAGVRLVWYLDPRARTVQVYTGTQRCESIGEDGVLSGGDVLPGFLLPVREWLAAPSGK